MMSAASTYQIHGANNLHLLAWWEKLIEKLSIALSSSTRWPRCQWFWRRTGRRLGTQGLLPRAIYSFSKIGPIFFRGRWAIAVFVICAFASLSLSTIATKASRRFFIAPCCRHLNKVKRKTSISIRSNLDINLPMKFVITYPFPASYY